MKKIGSLFLLLAFITISVSGQRAMTPEDLWKMGRLGDIRISPDNSLVLYGVSWYDLDKNRGSRDLYTIPVSGGEVKKITSFKGSEFNGIWRPDGRKIGFLSAEEGSVQIWEMNPDGSDKKIVSNIEGGISGFSYAPGMNHILYIKDVKVDKNTLDLYPDLPKADVRIIDDQMYRHWNDWTDCSYSHIFVAPYSTENGAEDGKDIMEGEPYDTPMMPWGGMEQITWSPDSKQIAYTCKKMTGLDYATKTNSEIYLYDLSDKSTNILSKGNEGYDHDPVFSPDGSNIVWKSMETPGFEADKERIIMMDLASGKKTDLSEGFDQSSSHFVWSEDGEDIYFISGYHATYQIYKVKVKNGKITKITEGVHNYNSFDLAGDVIVGTKMSMSMPTEIFSVSMDGDETQLSFTNKFVFDELEMGKVEKRWIKTTDNKDMLVWVIYPPFFDENKEYPALLYCQGGPQSAVSQFWSFRWNFQMMAANDYIIVAPNRRGLPTFGQEWNDQISGDYGGQNMKDYLSAIDEISEESFIDKDRLGSIGASYGGYSVLWLAGNHNKRFKAFISHCGIYNFESMYGSTEEYFFVNYDYEGAYWEDPKPKSYEFSPHLFVQNWDTPIMLITGEYDFRIPYTQSMEAFNAAQLRGVPSKLIIFPEETHFVLKPQNAILWQREFFGWLDKYLK